MARIFLFGSGGHARAVLDVLFSEDQHEIVGIVDGSRKKGTTFSGLPVLGGDDEALELADSYDVNSGIVAIGDNWRRAEVVRTIEAQLSEFTWVSSIHPNAHVAPSSTIGVGCVVMAGAVVGPNSVLDDFCIVNTLSSLDHDGTMGSFSSLAPGAHLGGRTNIGSFSAVCLGASVIHGVEIGPHTVVGAGATVLGDLPPRVVAFGSPAKVVRQRAEGESYL